MQVRILLMFCLFQYIHCITLFFGRDGPELPGGAAAGPYIWADHNHPRLTQPGVMETLAMRWGKCLQGCDVWFQKDYFYTCYNLYQFCDSKKRINCQLAVRLYTYVLMYIICYFLYQIYGGGFVINTFTMTLIFICNKGICFASFWHTS